MSISDFLPPSLNLPPHLSAHKYFFVCTLTVAAWDTLVLSPRSWKLFRVQGWPLLKILFNFMRAFMPIEFAITAVAFFDTKFTSTQCNHFYLFEPICTAILVSCCSLVHLVRMWALYPKTPAVKYGLAILFGLQVVAMGITCGFYRPMPLIFPAPPSNSGQGCIAGPKFADREVVGIYWLLPTIFYTASFALALARSFESQRNTQKKLSLWKLMLRDGLNLYGAIWIVNMVNMLFWFIATPTDETDTIKTIVTSMAAVLTTTMSLRIILSIRGSLANGGTYATGLSTGSNTASHSHSASRSAGVGGPRSMGMGVGINSQPGVLQLDRSGRQPQTFTISKTDEGKNGSGYGWDDTHSHGSVGYKPENDIVDNDPSSNVPGVKVTIEQHVDDGGYRH